MGLGRIGEGKWGLWVESGVSTGKGREIAAASSEEVVRNSLLQVGNVTPFSAAENWCFRPLDTYQLGLCEVISICFGFRFG